MWVKFGAFTQKHIKQVMDGLVVTRGSQEPSSVPQGRDSVFPESGIIDLMEQTRTCRRSHCGPASTQAPPTLCPRQPPSRPPDRQDAACFSEGVLQDLLLFWGPAAPPEVVRNAESCAICWHADL